MSGRPAVLVLLEEADVGGLVLEVLGEGEALVQPHVLSPDALQSDRAALAELDPVLSALAGRADVDPERVAACGLGRGGTLAFLLGCTRELAAVVDVEGPVLHPELGPQRPTQPLELALNLGGAFLGLFAREGRVGGDELALLQQRLDLAARPGEVLRHDGPEGFYDPRRSGYHAGRARETLRPLVPFLREHLAPDPDRS